MNWNEYIHYFDTVLAAEKRVAPYDDEDFFQYAKLNQARQNRWMKKDQLTEATKETLSKINQPQQWILITEPWCGDAAHIVPIIHQMAELNPLVTLDLQLRDSGSEINNYLTNGTKSIPILIVRNAAGEDIFRWGPRPAGAVEVVKEVKANSGDLEAMKLALQNWYNADKAGEVQNEISALIQQSNA